MSDCHLEDPDCKLMDPNWPEPEEYMRCFDGMGKNDTLIVLGDVGNPEWFTRVRSHKVLLLGNHDAGPSFYEPYFDEIYTGPLMIAEKIILSHEPIPDITWALNIHGHVHNADKDIDIYHLNCAADVVGYRKRNLSDIIKNGHLRYIISLHAQAINKAKSKTIEKELMRRLNEKMANKL